MLVYYIICCVKLCHVFVCIHLYIYIYIHRERERGPDARRLVRRGALGVEQDALLLAEAVRRVEGPTLYMYICVYIERETLYMYIYI